MCSPGSRKSVLGKLLKRFLEGSLGKFYMGLLSDLRGGKSSPLPEWIGTLEKTLKYAYPEGLNLKCAINFYTWRNSGIAELMSFLKRRKTNSASFSTGKSLKGNFTLVRLESNKEWLLIKQKDEHAQSGWKLETSLTPEKRAKLKERLPPCTTS